MKHQHRTAEHPLSAEDILIALDQLDQTVEVMGAVIRRLKRNLEHVLSSAPPADKASAPTAEFAGLLDPNPPESGWH